jgi:glucose-6-phosphate 1-dehydrogenase
MVGEAAELIAHQHSSENMTPYARLLGDALRGDGSLFTRDDCVEAAWRVLDPILENTAPLFEYEPDTWGPPEAERIVKGEGCWHNPTPPQQPGSQL